MVYLNNKEKEECIRMAQERHEQKKNYKSSKQLSPFYELVGILAEMIFAKITGYAMDKRLLVCGDDGYDFDNINVKGSEIHKARHLIEYIDKDFDGLYVFVVVDKDKFCGEIKGAITSKEFNKRCKIIDFGYGPRKALELDKLDKFYWNKVD